MVTAPLHAQKTFPACAPLIGSTTEYPSVVRLVEMKTHVDACEFCPSSCSRLAIVNAPELQVYTPGANTPLSAAAIVVAVCDVRLE